MCLIITTFVPLSSLFCSLLLLTRLLHPLVPLPLFLGHSHEQGQHFRIQSFREIFPVLQTEWFPIPTVLEVGNFFVAVQVDNDERFDDLQEIRSW